MEHDKSPQGKKRIIEVDRKIAAHLADVWMDMKLQIQSKLASKKSLEPSKLRNEVKQD